MDKGTGVVTMAVIAKDHRKRRSLAVIAAVLAVVCAGRLAEELIRIPTAHGAEDGAAARKIYHERIAAKYIAKFDDAPTEFNGVPAMSMLSFDVNFYETEEEWKNSRSATDTEEQKVRF